MLGWYLVDRLGELKISTWNIDPCCECAGRKQPAVYLHPLSLPPPATTLNLAVFISCWVSCLCLCVLVYLCICLCEFVTHTLTSIWHMICQFYHDLICGSANFLLLSFNQRKCYLKREWKVRMSWRGGLRIWDTILFRDATCEAAQSDVILSSPAPTSSGKPQTTIGLVWGIIENRQMAPPPIP